MKDVQTIITPHGEKLAVMRWSLYEDLLDAQDLISHHDILNKLDRGQEERLTSEEVLALLNAPTPLSFWRHKRGLTQAALGKEVGVSQNYIAQLEANERKGDPKLFKKLSEALGVCMEDLISD